MKELLYQAPAPARQKAVLNTLKDFPKYFSGEDEARNYLRSVFLPPSLRWAFISTGKNASSTVKRFLFYLEFGCELTAEFDSSTDINPAAIVHQLGDSNVFQRAIYVPLCASELLAISGIKRIAIVRHPFARIVSAFRYFCSSNELKSSWLLEDRLRINAMMGFDWRTMPYTEQGMLLFLSYIEHDAERFGAWRVDAHWRPQYDFIYPDVYRPTDIGKVENLHLFLNNLWEQLNYDNNACAPEIGQENRQIFASGCDFKSSKVRSRIEKVYAKDYEYFGYE
jgi:hypothetical protein